MVEGACGDGGQRVASFHVIRYRALGAVTGRAGLGLGHLALRRVEGLRFWRLLISTLGTSTDPWPRPVPHPTRFAFFAVWESTQALHSFLGDSPTAARWRSRAVEAWHVQLEPLQCRGTWNRQNPLGGSTRRTRPEGPVAILTYGRTRLRSWLPFWHFLPRPTGDAVRRRGLMALMLATEVFAPTVNVVTFSLWRTADEGTAFAYPQDNSDHGEAIRRLERGDWAKELLFARFRPMGSDGTWCGRDPLAALSGATTRTEG